MPAPDTGSQLEALVYWRLVAKEAEKAIALLVGGATVEFMASATPDAVHSLMVAGVPVSVSLTTRSSYEYSAECALMSEQLKERRLLEKTEGIAIATSLPTLVCKIGN